MIITVSEYKEMGFSADDDALLEKCIKRAEFVLNGISGGRATIIAQDKTPASDFVKQAAAFQTNAIYREETALLQSSESSSQSGSSTKSDERVTIGDFTYSTGTSSSSESTSKNSTTAAEPLDVNQTVARLLRAAGCFYGAAEVRE